MSKSECNNSLPFQKRYARQVRRLVSTVSALALGIASAVPAWAGGPNSSNPNPPPTPPPPLVTSEPQLDTVGQGGCAWQYTQAINDLGQDALDASAIGLAAQATGAAADVTSLIIEEAVTVDRAATFVSAGTAITGILTFPAAGPIFIQQGAAESVQAAALAAKITGAGATVSGLGSSIAGQVISQDQANLDTYVSENLPLCDTTFTGTVTVTGGGINVTGDSYFNGNVAINGDLNVSGNVTASQVHATQGISAHGGAIWLGDPDGVSYWDGITIGGGAFAGAGTGGALAFTGDVDAIAIGNGARAENANDTALGTGAQATGGGATAVGAGAIASGANAAAVGNSNASGDSSVAIGDDANASGTQSVAVGQKSSAAKKGAVAVGGDTDDDGVGANASEIGSIAIGDASATNTDAIAVGTGASASGVGSIAIGQGASATGSIAMGTLSSASNGGAAYGDNSTATGANSTAVGPSASATPDGSAAFGYGAVATLADQQVFGTTSNTYTAPGITSDLSQRRQSGPLELVTTDSHGNLASDNGDTFTTISKLQAGVSIALAAEAPSLTSSESFGIRMGWGNFEGNANAASVSAIGVVCRSCVSLGDRIAIDGAVGAGWSNYETYSSDTVVGGRAGVQWTW